MVDHARERVGPGPRVCQSRRKMTDTKACGICIGLRRTM